MSRRRPIPGDALVGPAGLGAAALIVFNDFWLKRAHPGWWSGKLSDIGLCLLMPLVLYAAIEWVAWLLASLRGRTLWPGRAAIWLSCALSALYFSAMKLWPAFAALHASVLAWLTPGRGRLRVVCDPTDLPALVMVALAWWLLDRSLQKRLRVQVPALGDSIAGSSRQAVDRGAKP